MSFQCTRGFDRRSYVMLGMFLVHTISAGKEVRPTRDLIIDMELNGLPWSWWQQPSSDPLEGGSPDYFGVSTKWYFPQNI